MHETGGFYYMNPSTVPALRSQFRRLRRMYFVFLLLAVAALVCYFFDPRLTLVVLGLSLGLNLIVGRRASKSYKENFTRAAAMVTLEKHLDAPYWRDGVTLTEAEVRDARMIPTNAGSGGTVCHQGGGGSYRGCQVLVEDVTIAHSFTESGKKRHNFTVGSWVRVDLGRDTGLDCRFLGEGILSAQSLKEMLWVETDLRSQTPPAPLDPGWWVLTTESNPALPDTTVLRQIERLRRDTDSQIALAIEGQYLHCLLVGRLIAQTVSSRQAPGDSFEKADLLPELSQILNLCDKLK